MPVSPTVLNLGGPQPARWAYAANASAMGLVWAKEGDEGQDWIALAGAGHYVMDPAVLGALCVLATGVGLLLVRSSATAE